MRFLTAFEGSGDAFEVLHIKQDDFTFLPFEGSVPPLIRPTAPVWDIKSKMLLQGKMPAPRAY